MVKRLFKPIQIGGATALISLTSLLSYGIGLVRDRVIATSFGTTNATDAYNASFLIPDILFNFFIAGALSAAFLPVFSEYLVKDKEEAQKLANTMLNSASVLIGTLALIAFILMPYIVPFAFQDADPTIHQDIINMTRIMLFSAMFFAISNTLGNILMSYRHFFSYSMSPVLYNLGIILGVIFLQDSLGIYSAAIGVVIGAAFHCLIRVIDTMHTEYKYKAQIQLNNPGFKKILKLMVPRSIGLIAWQINLLIYGITAIRMTEGGFTAFNYARNIQSFAVSLFGIAFATAVFPYLSNALGRNEKEEYTGHIQKTIQRILFFTIPSAVGIMLLGKPIIVLILGGGAFQERSIDLTALILFYFALSIPFESLSHILARGFYAMQNTFTPMLVNISGMFIIACITYFVAPIYGIQWFSIGFTIGYIFYVLALTTILRKHLQGFKTKEFLISLGKTALSTTAMVAIILAISALDLPLASNYLVLIKILIGSLAFFFISSKLKIQELESIKYVFARFFKKSTV